MLKRDHDESTIPPAALAFLAGGGEMGARMRELDWTRTPLGSPDSWPQALKTGVRIVLTSRQPMFIWWGDQLINLYNDAYKSIVGGKHPAALGQPASLVWREIWDQVGPRAQSCMRGDEGTYDESLLLIMERNGYPEETYYTFSYSPVANDQGGTGGIFCANTDHTQLVIGQRQLALLGDLAANASHANSLADVCAACAESLQNNARDLPFALLYLLELDGGRFSLASCSGAIPDTRCAPRTITRDDRSAWPLAEALDSPHAHVVSDLTHLGALPQGSWDRPPSQAVLIPVALSGPLARSGVLVVGLSPYRVFDDGYRAFLELVAGQISTGIAKAEAYAEEKRRAEMLAEIDRAKTAFFSNVSHEFRTPLTLMLGPLEEALGAPERALTGENLDTTYRNALRLLKLVNSLLDFSRIEAGRAQASYQETDLGALTRDLASAFRSAVVRAGLTFDVTCDALPQPVLIDHDMWEKIVLNLLSNALKFTFDGAIRVALRDGGEYAELSVQDTGTGIPHDELPHLFKRFHRVHNARSRTHEGSGIGLALVAELVKLQGGQIEVTSELGRGTTFTLRVPYGAAHLPSGSVRVAPNATTRSAGVTPYIAEALRWLPRDDQDPWAAEESDVQPSQGRSTMRILLADDNADMRDYMLRLLADKYTVEAVADGALALASAKREPPDLILTDVMMPNLDGFGLLRALRADPRLTRVPVVMLSARAGEESRVEGLEAGADDYLPKPFASRELLARVSTHLELGRLRAVAEYERNKLAQLFMQAPVPIAVFEGQELRHSVANPPYCAMVGRSEVIGKTVHEVFPELGEHEAFATLRRVFETDEPVRVAEMNVAITRNGVSAEAFFNYVAQPIRDAESRVSSVMVVAIEITEQVLARRRVENLRAAAEQANRAKDEFLSTLSHELRTPLNAIVGWSQMLRSGSVPLAQHEKALETVERNARVQARLIEDMLDLARIEQGKVVLSVGPIDVKRVVEAAVDAVRPGADAKGVRLQPVLDSHATIVGDPDRLQQIVWNLLSNAIKFTPRGGRVQVCLRREQSHVEISVADSGQGIDANFLPHVFDRFRQGDGSFSRHAGGLGLGLAIVRSLVELHGGVVTASSAGADLGSTFVVKLPTAPIRAGSAAPPALEIEPGVRVQPHFDCPPVLKDLRILVVDDEPDTRELLRFVIGQCDAHVTTAGSAGEALRLLVSGHFDVLISDVGMPGEDGYALLQKVRMLPAEHGGRIPALALTAYARSEDRMHALKSGFNMHLAKPIDPGELLVVIATLIGAYAPNR